MTLLLYFEEVVFSLTVEINSKIRVLWKDSFMLYRMMSHSLFKFQDFDAPKLGGQRVCLKFIPLQSKFESISKRKNKTWWIANYSEFFY